MSTITHDQEQTIRDWLTAHPILTVGVGTEDRACSVAAINLALTGELTDEVPDCMSRVIGQWIIGIQDRMPYDIRNSDAWRDLLPLAAGTGRDHEPERIALIMGWMWDTVLPIAQSAATTFGFGDAWRRMCVERTVEATIEALAATFAVYDAAPHELDITQRRERRAHASAITSALASAVECVVTPMAMANIPDYPIHDTTMTMADAAESAAHVAGYVANVAYYTDSTQSHVTWQTIDPVGVLRRLVAVPDTYSDGNLFESF